jgi:hypothetical protein
VSDEPGLIYRRLGGRRDGKVEVVEMWDVSVQRCIHHGLYNGERSVLERRVWISALCADSVRLYEAAHAEV